jgi:hypothetical protein
MQRHELTPAQAREIAGLRRRHPGAEVRTHERPWGVIVEVRRGGHVVELERFDFGGATTPEQRIGVAA